MQETHSCEADTFFWKNQWGDNIIFSHGSDRSGGVAICFNRFPGEIVASKIDKDGHWITVVVNLEGKFAILINIYGHNNDAITENIAEFKNMYGLEFTLMGHQMIGLTDAHPGTMIITIILY